MFAPILAPRVSNDPIKASKNHTTGRDPTNEAGKIHKKNHQGGFRKGRRKEDEHLRQKISKGNNEDTQNCGV